MYKIVKIVGRLKLTIAKLVLSAAVICLVLGGRGQAAVESAMPVTASSQNPEPSEQQKSKVLRGIGQDWILVGLTQYNRGLYHQAEESFLNAAEFQEYLTAEENKQLKEHLGQTRNAATEKQAVLERVKIANDLLSQGQPIKARAYYEQVRNSPYLTDQQRSQIADEIQNVDENFDKQMKEITKLYNRSVELYRTGEFEKAREGFADVARYGQYVAPEGRSAEDYLLQIDNILTERFKQRSSAESTPPPVSQSAVPPAQKPQNSGPAALAISNQPAQSDQQRAAEVAAISEPAPAQPEPDVEARAKILRTYTKAVVEDTVAQVQKHIVRRDFDKAIDSVRNATGVVSKNRSFIGDKLFAKYSILLKQLTDKIIEAQKAPQ